MKKTLVIVLTLVMLLTLFVGCSQESATEVAVDDAGDAGVEVVAEGMPEGIVPGTSADLAIGMDYVTQQFPGQVPPAHFMYSCLYDTLFYAVGGDFNNMDGLLVKDYTISEDKLEWVLNLEEEVYFRNGKNLTAENVIGCFDYYKPDQGAVFSQMLSYEATDTYQVTIKLDSPMPELIRQLAVVHIGIFDHTVIQGRSSTELTAEDAVGVGSGPYYVSDFKPGDYLTMTANDTYWNEERMPHIETLNCKIILDPTTQVASMQTGEMDFVQLNDYNSYEILSGEKDITLVDGAGANRCLWFNVDGVAMAEGETAYPEAWAAYEAIMADKPVDEMGPPPGEEGPPAGEEGPPAGEEMAEPVSTDGMYHVLENENVRKAITMMVDMEQANIAGNGGYGDVLNNCFNEAIPYEHTREYDPAKALEILAEEGVDPSDITLSALCNAEVSGLLSNVQSQLSEYGVTLEYTVQDVPAVMTLGMKGEWDIWTEHGGMSEYSFISPIKMLIGPDAAFNMFNDPTLDPQIWALVNEASVQESFEEELVKIADVAQLCGEHYGYIGNIRMPAWGAYSNNIGNIVVSGDNGEWLPFYSYVK